MKEDVGETSEKGKGAAEWAGGCRKVDIVAVVVGAAAAVKL